MEYLKTYTDRFQKNVSEMFDDCEKKYMKN